jgi:hypothetical protein
MSLNRMEYFSKSSTKLEYPESYTMTKKISKRTHFQEVFNNSKLSPVSILPLKRARTPTHPIRPFTTSCDCTISVPLKGSIHSVEAYAPRP